MTLLLEQALATVRRLPAAEQDYVARAMINLAQQDGNGAESTEPAHLPGIQRGLEQMRQRAFASDEDVAAAFARFGK